MHNELTDRYRERLTLKTIRILTADCPGDLADKGRKVLDYSEVHFGLIAGEVQELSRSGKHPPVACKKGCAHCCYTQVEATSAEVKALARHIESNFTESERAHLVSKLRAHRDELHRCEAADEPRPPMPCPLLEDECCTAHIARPLACRTFNSVDVGACIKARENWQEPAQIPALGKQVIAASGIHDGLIAGLKTLGESAEMLEMPTALLEELGG